LAQAKITVLRSAIFVGRRSVLGRTPKSLKLEVKILKTISRSRLRFHVTCLVLGVYAAVICQPAAAQETSDKSSSRRVNVTGLVPQTLAPAETNAEAEGRIEMAAATGPVLFSLTSVPPIAFAAAAFPGANLPADLATLAAPPVAINYALPNSADRCDLLSKSGLAACLSNILHDQPNIWTAPAHVHRRDTLWLLPLVGATAAAFIYDDRTLSAVGSAPTTVRISNDFSNSLGSGYALGAAAVGIYFVGHFTDNERVRETSMITLEALADAGIVSEGLKLATNRIRPDGGPEAGIFWADGRPVTGGETELYTLNGSFPSGHTMATWAAVHVLVDETPGYHWLHVGLYALAAGVGIARVFGRDHYPSDVVVGAPLGFLIGGFVYRQRSQFYQKSPRKTVSVSPLYNAGTRTYGVGISFVP
jgi:membrane-associated phospholipid phosphatase